jgi:3-keto-5-aminohexanoate cleavage enzyme
MNEWSIAAGGHARTGLEDNVRIDCNTFAPSNAALVTRATELCEKYNRRFATWQQTRDILGLRTVTT